MKILHVCSAAVRCRRRQICLFGLFLAGLLSLFLLPKTVQAADQTDTRVVRVGYYTMSNFQEYDQDTRMYRGYSYDYMLALAQYAGWRYEFVKVSYDQGLKMLEDGELDLMNNVEQTTALSDKLSFSSISSGQSNTCLVVAPDNTDVSYEDFTSIESLTVGLCYTDSMNSGFVDYCKDNDCMPKLVYYHTQEGVDNAMAAGEVNACLVSSLQDVNMRTIAKFNTKSYYFATTKGNSALLKELNTAMNALKTSDPYFEEKIYEKYHTGSAEERTVISAEEKTWIKENPVITVAYNPDWYPLSYTDSKGSFAGSIASVYKLISERTGLQFRFICGATSAESLQLFTSGKAQIMAVFPYDYTWAKQKGARITTPFTTLTISEAYRTGTTPSEHDTAAVTAGDYRKYLASAIRKDSYHFVEYDTVDECMDAVKNGSADCVFLDNYQQEYYRERARYRDLSYKVMTGREYSLSIAVSMEADQALYSIVSKALSSAGTGKLDDIFKETTFSGKPSSLVDVLYSNPKAAVFFLVLVGFIVAIIISAVGYSFLLHRKNRQLKAVANAKSDFLSNISHDMRTPLNGIIGYTDLAVSTDNPQEKQDYLKKIGISGRFLLNLINDTLDISKIESGKYTLSPAPVSGSELLESIVVPIRLSAKAKNIDFTISADPQYYGMLNVDRLNLQKIVLNLLSNAIKFTPSGGSVRLLVNAVEPPEGNINTRIIVEDTGVGISEEFMPDLFEPFMQERTSQTRGIVGTGLGLSIVKRVAVLMGGDVAVESQKGKGSRFTVSLPIAFSGEKKEETPAEAEKESLAGLSVLLCEDNQMNTEIAKKLLEKNGLHVTCAENGKAGLEIFKKSEPGTFDVILMDLRMPVMNGIEAAGAIRALQREDAAAVPIIALSADVFEEDLRRCREAGMNDHTVKPINPEELFDCIRRCCRKKGAE